MKLIVLVPLIPPLAHERWPGGGASVSHVVCGWRRWGGGGVCGYCAL